MPTPQEIERWKREERRRRLDPNAPSPTDDEMMLFDNFCSMRLDIIALEQLIEAGEWTEQDVKRLDKVVTVIKVGMKLMKKVLRSHGYAAPSRTAKEEALLTQNEVG